jgi:thiol-disulfide isomerase/thioredoxin
MTLGKKILAAVLYAALTPLANPVFADGADPAMLTALRAGDMKKLAVHSDPKPVSSVAFTTLDGVEKTLADYAGKTVLVNFWATWCAPCRAEMPALNTLQQNLGGEDFEVVTIATGRNPLPTITKFFDQNAITDLPILLDPKRALSRDAGVFGMPTTFVMNADGLEVARMTGDADWASEDAVLFLRAVMGE